MFRSCDHHQGNQSVNVFNNVTLARNSVAHWRWS